MTAPKLTEAQRELLLFIRKRRGLPRRRGNTERRHKDYLLYRSVCKAGWVVTDDGDRSVSRFHKLTDAGRAALRGES